MKTVFALLLLCGISSVAFSQKSNWDGVQLKKEQDYKTAEPKVKEAAAYLLSHPYSIEDASTASAGRFLILWMTGTPDYSYSVLGNILKLDPDGNKLMAPYMAALIKVGFDSPEKLKDIKASELAAMKLIAEYCENPANKIKQTAEVKKVIKANKDGKLAEVLEFGDTGK